jgi:PST family polysaccharide transporter
MKLYTHLKTVRNISFPAYLFSVYTRSNVFTLGLFGTNTMVGYYSAAEKLFIALQQAYLPVNNSIYPYMTKNKKCGCNLKKYSGL